MFLAEIIKEVEKLHFEAVRLRAHNGKLRIDIARARKRSGAGRCKICQRRPAVKHD